MSFQLDASNIPTLDDFAAAEAFYNKTKPWASSRRHYYRDYTSARPLDKHNRSKRHVNIRPVGTNAVDGYACRLHNTDVVTYYRDGTIELQHYSSVSTNNFASALLPSGLFLEAMSYMVCVTNSPYRWTDKARAYRFNDNGRMLMRRTGDKEYPWEPDPSTPPEPFRHCTLNRKRANAALKEHNFSDFKAWVQALIAMKAERKQVNFAVHVTPGGWLQCLADQSQWPKLLECCHSLDSWVDRAQSAVYALKHCIDVEEVPFATSYQHARTLMRSESTWGHLL